jgi:hypothetical protein
MNNKIKVLLILCMLIAFSMPVHALSFGTHVKNSEINLQKGETGIFRILFFSRDPNPVKFLLSLEESPKDFIIVYPETIELNSGSGEDYILMDNEYVSTKTLEVDVKVPFNAESREHTILLKASSISQNEQQNSLGVNTEKTFLLKINVLGGPSKSGTSETFIESSSEDDIVENILTENKEEDKIIEDDEEDGSPVSGMMLADNNIYFWLIFIALIALASYLIYRKI